MCTRKWQGEPGCLGLGLGIKMSQCPQGVALVIMGLGEERQEIGKIQMPQGKESTGPL